MGWEYQQSTGVVKDPSGRVTGKGYSGNGAGKDNPEMQRVEKVGPIPVGSYLIGYPHDSETLGKYVMELKPDVNNQMFGRAGFFLHGDSLEHPGEASEGCIVLPPVVRHLIGTSGVRTLTVIA